MTILKEKANHEESNSSDFEGLKEEEIERLRGFLTSLDKPSASCFLAKLDKYFMTSCFSVSKDCWDGNSVTNLSARNHMTHNSHHFLSYNSCPGNQKVKIAYGSLASVANKGLLPLSHLFP